LGTVGQSRRIVFWITDANSRPVTGRTLSSFSITLLRNGSPCSDPLTLTDLGNGEYALQYTPSAAGTDDLQIDDNVIGLHFRDIEAVGVQGDAPVTLMGDLLPSYPNLAPSVLYAYFSSDWSTGNTNPSFAQGSYQLDSTGQWSLLLLPGVYDLILRDASGTTIVFQTNVEVA